METFLERQPSKIEEIRRLVMQSFGKFDELKYPSGDLMREIDFEYPKKRKKNGK